MTLAKQILARRIGTDALKDIEIRLYDFLETKPQGSIQILHNIWLVKHFHQFVICSDVENSGRYAKTPYSGRGTKTPYFVIYNPKLYQTHWAEGVLLFLKGSPTFVRGIAPCWHSLIASSELDEIDHLIRNIFS